ncbi:MAG: hypothetical protein ACI4IS_01195 [Acutalibacteraceae bacterium]
MAKLKTELKEFIAEIKSQGSQGSKMLSEILAELSQHFPLVLHIADTPTTKEDTKTVYKVTDTQTEINEIIYELSQSETAVVVVHDKGVTLNFNHIEIEDDMVTCHLSTFDGEYTLYLSKEDGFSELWHTTN